MATTDELVAQADCLKQAALTVQDESRTPEERKALLEDLSARYHNWYRQCLAHLESAHDADARQKFEREYEGSFFAQKILAFLTDGLLVSPLFDPEKPNPIVPKWTYPVLDAFQKPIIKQCNYLAAAASRLSGPESSTSEGWNRTICRILDAFIDKADNAKTNQEKKLSYEYLALFLIGAIEGLKVIGHDSRGSAEEVDLWVANHSTEPFLQKHLGDPFMVECKNWESPVGRKGTPSSQVRNGRQEDAIRGRPVRTGVTGKDNRDAREVIHRAFRDGKIIVVLDRDDLLRCSGGVCPSQILEEKVYELFKRA